MTIAESRSAVGPLYKIPSTPMNMGKIIRGGRKNIICLVMERNAPFSGLPMDVKNVVVIGYKQLSHVKNRNMRKKFSPKRKYSSVPSPKREIISLGNI